MVLVKHPKHQGGEFGGVSVGEELRVDLDEALLGQQAVRTVLEEPFVPLFNLFFGD